MSSQDNHKEFKVLLVEDNPGDAFLVKFYLEESNSESETFQVEHAEELHAAYAKMDASAFDIVLLDLNLPDSSGLATLRSLLEKYPDYLVIVLTGTFDEKLGMEAVQSGAQDFLSKGRYDSKVLSSSIRYAIGRSNLDKKEADYREEFELNRWRMNFLERTLGVRYAEFFESGDAAQVSENLLKGWGISDLSELNLESFLNRFDQAEELRSIVADLNSNGEHKSIAISESEGKGKFDGGVDKSRCPVRKKDMIRFLLRPI
jgi:DNA-binding response OmpR family regulator